MNKFFRRKYYYSGLTLVEIMISLSLFSLLLLAIGQIISYNQRRLNYLSTQLDLQLTLHKVVELMSKDLKRTGLWTPEGKMLIETSKEKSFYLDLTKINTSKKYQCIIFSYEMDKKRKYFGYRFENENIVAFSSKKLLIPNCKGQRLYWNSLFDDDLYQITDFFLQQVSGKENNKQGIRIFIEGRLKKDPKIIYQVESIVPLFNQ